MSNIPKISVVLTSYNHAKYLRKSIQSVLDQTYKDYELIILDDGSTDNSWEIINSFNDPRIRVYRNEVNRKGISMIDVIRNIAQCEFVGIHHSDDMWEKQRLEKQISVLEENPQVGAVFSLVTIIDEEDRPFLDKNHKYYQVFDQPNRTRYEWLNYFFYLGNGLCHPSLLIRKKCYSHRHTPMAGLAQLPDLNFWIRLCLTYEIFILQERLVRFRVRADEKNVSGNRPDARIRDHFEKLQLLNNYRHISNTDEFVRIFPAASKYVNESNADILYALGRLSVDTGPSMVHKLFGLNLLFEAINNPDRATKIREHNNFNTKDFIKLTGEYDIFSTEVSYNIKYDLINGKAWKMVENTRRLRDLLAPPGSRRSRQLIRINSGILEILSFIKQYRKNRQMFESINASQQFDPEYYLQSNPDLASLKIDPLVHYCKTGWKEGRNPNQNFDTNTYSSKHPEVITLDICPLYHWIQHGLSKGELTIPIKDPLDGIEN